MLIYPGNKNNDSQLTESWSYHSYVPFNNVPETAVFITASELELLLLLFPTKLTSTDDDKDWCDLLKTATIEDGSNGAVNMLIWFDETWKRIPR